jgi:fibrillarin-like pre-rRNA processing protein
VKVKKLFPGVFEVDGKLMTVNSSPGYRVYNEKLFKAGGMEYRQWDPFRSKLGAAIKKGLKDFPFTEKSNVLYLGASSGTTPSHVADITGGAVYCVEFSKRMMRELVPVTMRKKNMVPILADANHPKEYANLIGAVDVVYQDVAQPNQAEILWKNVSATRAKRALISIKARSINSVESPKKVFRAEVERLKEHFAVIEEIDLQPFEEDHVLVNLKLK